MKNIIYKDIVEFNLPDHWVAEDDNGVGVFYEQGDEIGTLRLELLIAQSPDPVTDESCIDMLQALTKGSENIERLDSGNACRCFFEEVNDRGDELFIHYWFIANAIKPDTGRMATFSFTTLKSRKEEESTLQIIGMLDREIRACKFL